MTRKILILILVCLCFVLSSCNHDNTAKHFLQKTPDKILSTEGGGEIIDFGQFDDFGSLKRLAMHADIVVSGTVKKATSMYLDETKGIMVSDITFRCEETYLGPHHKTIQFKVETGYLPTAIREQELLKQGFINNFLDQYSEEEKQNSYIEKRTFNRNIMMPGDQFILFLRIENDGSYSLFQDIKIEDEYANTTYNGREYQSEYVFEYLPTIDVDDLPTCEYCHWLRKPKD